MTYRECEIRESRTMTGWYEWHHPAYVDYDQHGDTMWCGAGQSIEDCIIEIDSWYERFGL